jgi:hypothetical protein
MLKMLIEIFIFFEVIMLVLFFTSFFTKQEIIWAITLVLSGTLMFTSYNIETYVYEFNNTLGAYSPILTTNTYPYLMAINMIFFVLALVLGLFDLFDKYGQKFAGKKGKNHREV